MIDGHTDQSQCALQGALVDFYDKCDGGGPARIKDAGFLVDGGDFDVDAGTLARKPMKPDVEKGKKYYFKGHCGYPGGSMTGTIEVATDPPGGRPDGGR